MKTFIFKIIFLVALLANLNAKSQIILFEDFDNNSFIPLRDALSKDKHVVIDKNLGTRGSNGIRLIYEGFERGSKRILHPTDLKSHFSEAELVFDIKFSQDFDFVRGGKLHGLGPENPVAGLKPVEDHRWSARLVFTKSGGIKTYIYHQNMKKASGSVKKAENFAFVKERFYNIRMRVKLNNKDEDGWVKVWIDDKLMIEHLNIKFRNKFSKDTKISKFLFSTFHGGHKKSYAPKTSRGEYKKVHAYMDNIIVNGIE